MLQVVVPTGAAALKRGLGSALGLPSEENRSRWLAGNSEDYSAIATTHKRAFAGSPTWRRRLKRPGQNAGGGRPSVRPHAKAAAVTVVAIPQPPRT